MIRVTEIPWLSGEQVLGNLLSGGTDSNTNLTDELTLLSYPPYTWCSSLMLFQVCGHTGSKDMEESCHH